MPSHSVSSCALLVLSNLMLLLLAASNGDAASGNVTAGTISTSGNTSSSSATTTAAADESHGPETYTCVLCAGRNVMLMRWCPIYWDECHLVCNNHDAAATLATADSDSGDDDECYVMKLYNGGRSVIVATMRCGQVKTCGLTCGGGERLGAGWNALPDAAVTPVLPAAAAFQGPRLADSQRCGGAAMASARSAVQRGA
ncbi:hypothetical protein QOZ80_2AG0110250 [Eleusine coracana subsp. coracana]|nr:hypothetical protein QOZ80_2AG0110250 [Eleusine coracana subsp. coracana]